MKKITLLFSAVFLLAVVNVFGQFSFPAVPGPVDVTYGVPITLNINDMANSAGVPTTGTYSTFSVSVDWISTNNAWSSEADLTMNTTGSSVLVDPATTGGTTSGAATTLTFDGTFQVVYDPATDGTLDIVLNQSYNPSAADWSNIVVTIFPTPSCPSPTALTATSITSSSASLGWTAGGSESLWDVELVDITGGGSATGTPTATGVSNPYMAMSLADNNDYEFYVRADCGGAGVSTWSGPFAFTTLCNAFVPDYTEGFDPFLPACWEEAGSGTPGTGPSDLGSGSWTNDGWLNSGTTGAARINLYTTGREEWLISPIFDLTAGGYELTYLVAITDFANSNPPELLGMGVDDEVQVLITDDSGATWTNLRTYNQSDFPSHTGDQEFFDLSAYDGATVQFAFWATDGSVNDTEDYDFFIDNFSVRTPPSCSEPSSLNAGNITAFTAELSWTDNAGASVFDIELVDVTGGGSATGTPTFTGVANPYTAMGLTDNNDYEYYVRADCGGSTSVWVGPFGFTTACDTFAPGYTADFTNVAPECWSEGDNTDIATGPNGLNGGWVNDDYLNTVGIEAAKFNLYNLTDTGDWLVSPTFDFSSGGNGLAFDVGVTAFASTNPETPNLMGSDDEVQILYSIDGGANWISLETFNVANAPSHLGEPRLYDLTSVTSSNVVFALWANEGLVDDAEDVDFFVANFRVDLLSNLSTDDVQEIANFKYFPNPVDGTLSLRAQGIIQNVDIFNMLGQKVMQTDPHSVSYELDLTSLQAGAYFMQVTIDGRSDTIKLIKN